MGNQKYDLVPPFQKVMEKVARAAGPAESARRILEWVILAYKDKECPFMVHVARAFELVTPEEEDAE